MIWSRDVVILCVPRRFTQRMPINVQPTRPGIKLKPKEKKKKYTDTAIYLIKLDNIF